MISEQRKWLAYQGALGAVYFWRTYNFHEMSPLHGRSHVRIRDQMLRVHQHGKE